MLATIHSITADASLQRFDADLFAYVTARTDMVNADGAQTAQLANQILTNVLGERAAPDLPHAFVGMDLTHALRRVVSLPFDKADGVKTVVELLMLHTGSILQCTRNRADMKAMLRAHVDAKHRFDSLLGQL